MPALLTRMSILPWSASSAASAPRKASVSDQVAHECRALRALTGQLRGQFVEQLLAPGQPDDRRAACGQCQRDGAPDARRRAGDDRDPAVETGRGAWVQVHPPTLRRTRSSSSGGQAGALGDPGRQVGHGVVGERRRGELEDATCRDGTVIVSGRRRPWVSVAQAELDGDDQRNGRVPVLERVVLDQVRAEHRSLGREVGVEVPPSETGERRVQGGVGEMEARRLGDPLGRRLEDRLRDQQEIRQLDGTDGLGFEPAGGPRASLLQPIQGALVLADGAGEPDVKGAVGPAPPYRCVQRGSFPGPCRRLRQRPCHRPRRHLRPGGRSRHHLTGPAPPHRRSRGDPRGRELRSALAQRPASSQSLVTVFQLRVVLRTPRRRSKNVPVYLVPA